jgi:hypothetical protein
MEAVVFAGGCTAQALSEDASVKEMDGRKKDHSDEPAPSYMPSTVDPEP